MAGSLLLTQGSPTLIVRSKTYFTFSVWMRKLTKSSLLGSHCLLAESLTSVLIKPAPGSVSQWKGLRNLPPTKIPRLKGPPELGRY